MKRGMTMSFEFACPQCGNPVSVDESYRGQVVECPHCAKGIVVPKCKSTGEVLEADTKTVHIQCPQCGDEISIDESDRGQVVVCQGCGKSIVVPRSKPKVIVKQKHQVNSGRRGGHLLKAVTHKSKVLFVDDLVAECPYCHTVYDVEPQEIGMTNVCERCMRIFRIETKRRLTRNESLAQQRQWEHTYICTNCGAATATPTIAHAGKSGCLFIIVFIPLCGILYWLQSCWGIGFPFYIHPICYIGAALIFLFLGLLLLSKGETILCQKCGRPNTLIPVATPQGRRLLKEITRDAVTEKQPVSSPPSSLAPSASSTEQTPASDRLKRMQKLLDEGLISADEYEIQRKRILESL